ncbi:MAG: hypothetical protein HY319_19830, partial [Armatimonadetes bacterium]|nr:hypothetical protein [Armatimonadota bacterium]
SHDVEKNGFTADSVQKLKAMEGDLKDVITPENVAFLRGLDADSLDRMFSPENLQQLRSVAPELGEKLTGERVGQLTGALRGLQQVDAEQVNAGMNRMAPWVNTVDSQGNVREGYLNMVDRMIGDPNKLGGADRTFSQEDILEVTRAAMRHGVTHDKIDQAIRNDSRVRFNRRGRERLPVVQNVITSAVHKRATPERVTGQIQSHTRDKLGSRGLPTSDVPRNFTPTEMNRLFQAGDEAMRLQRSAPIASSDADVQQMNRLQQGIVGPLQRSIDVSDGVSQAEVHNLAELANFGYRMLDKFRQTL